MFPVRIYYESAAYGSAISHRRSSVRARAPGLARPPRPVAPPFIEPVSLSVHRAPFEPTSLRASRAPDGAHHVPGFEPAEARFMMSDLTGMP
jgi:hypothetical protein